MSAEKEKLKQMMRELVEESADKIKADVLAIGNDPLRLRLFCLARAYESAAVQILVSSTTMLSMQMEVLHEVTKQG